MAVFPTIDKGIYRHGKTGREYEVLGVAFHTETEELLVVYRPQYESEYELFTRPYEMFIEDISVNGITMPRFKKVNE